MTKKQFDWINVIFLLGTPVMAVLLTWAHIKYEGLNMALLVPFALLYVLTGISITAGYHRLFSHRTYSASKEVKLFYLIFGAGAFQNSVLKWARDHRKHHKFVDKKKDPYSIKEGFFYAHMGWIFYKESENEGALPKDLLNDPLVKWQHDHYFVLATIVGFIIPLIIGLMMNAPIGGLAILGFMRIVLVHHCTFFINSLCHMIGNRPFTDENSARDNFILSFFTYGEGFHNFHHKFQTDYRNGLRWYHWDPTKWMIQCLYLLGRAHKLKRVPDHEILKAKLLMSEKRLGEKGKHHFEFLENLRNRVLETELKFQELKKDYRCFKKEFPRKKELKLLELKINLAKAKSDFNLTYRQWQFTVKKLHQMA